jgi:hypothetical protein
VKVYSTGPPLCSRLPANQNVSTPVQGSMSDSNIPLRDERRVCYIARDAFFTCCDKNRIDNPLNDVDGVRRLCKKEKAKFERDCMASWVRAFPMLLKLLLRY